MTLRVTPRELVELAEVSGAPGLLARAPGWGRIRVDRIAKIINGAPFSSRHFNKDGRGLPLIRIRDVGQVTPSTWYDGPFEPYHLVEPGSILVGMDGDFRVDRWRGPTGLLNQRVCRIEVEKDVYEERFLFLVLQGYLDAIWKATSSTTVKHLSSRSVAEIPLPLPPLEEQRRIVDILEDHLSRLDAARVALGNAGLRQKALRSALLERLPRTTDLVGRLGDIAVASGYGTSSKCVEGGPGPAVVRIPNLRDGRVDLTDEKRVADPDADVSGLILRSGDLLIVRTNGSRDLVGRSAVVQEGVDAAFASYLIRFRLDQDRVVPRWVQAILESPSMRRRLESMAASSAGQYNLGLAKLASLPIPLPSAPDEQVRRLDKLDGLLDGLEVVTAALDKADRRMVRLRSSLLAAAFSGRLSGTSSEMDRVEELAGV